jgi:hypothetical protein
VGKERPGDATTSACFFHYAFCVKWTAYSLGDLIEPLDEVLHRFLGGSTQWLSTRSAGEPVCYEEVSYQALGPAYAEEKAVEASKRWALRRLKQLGYQVTLQPTEGA